MTCKKCSNCCKYVSLQIDTPEETKDFENIIWYIMHHNVTVYIDHEDDWIIEFKTPCKSLTDDGLCDIHPTRPTICRDHEPETCESNGTDSQSYQYLFETPQDVIDYVREHTLLKNFRQNKVVAPTSSMSVTI
ncbi:MAG: YkgJ family cysteine cluster protein [Nanoarchaeota archaeon]|nr:YkgJ family cysteine cluster protein [Nanoarchaeota archaeon]